MENLKFEDAIKKLEDIAKELEKGELGLEESVAKFEEGMKLSKECNKMLNEVEKKINIILTGEEGIIEEAGKDHLIIRDPMNNVWYLIRMIYLNYVEFMDPIIYSHTYSEKTY